MKLGTLLRILPFVLLLAAAMLFLLRPPRYEPSGDPLYDRFAKHVLRQFSVHGYNCTLGKDDLGAMSMFSWQPNTMDLLIQRFLPSHTVRMNEPYKVDTAAIDAWESDFGADPRYWQLRVNCGLEKAWLAPPEDHTFGSPYDSGPYIKRLQAGIVDRGSCAVLPLSSIYASDDPLCLQLLAQAAELDPDNSYWHFRLALLYQSLGEGELALAEFEACSGAPENTWVWSFPYSTLFDERYSKSSAPGNRIVRGLLYCDQSILGSANIEGYLRFKEAYKEGQAMLALGGDPRYADAQIRAAGRLGQMRGINSTGILVAAICAKMPSEYFRTDMLSGPIAADPRLLEIASFDVELRDRMKQRQSLLQRPGVCPTPFLAAFDQFNFPGGSTPPAASYGYSAAAPSGGLPPLQIDDWINFALLADQEQEFHESCAPLFDSLKDPPLARLYQAALDGSYAAPPEAETVVAGPDDNDAVHTTEAEQ